jgi:hypothetical protein
MFEVKATGGEEGVIELGPSEVRAAQGAARTNRYRILFIRNALDSARRSVHILPNPFGESGRDSYRAVGTGLKFQFRVTG